MRDELDETMEDTLAVTDLMLSGQWLGIQRAKRLAAEVRRLRAEHALDNAAGDSAFNLMKSRAEDAECELAEKSKELLDLHLAQSIEMSKVFDRAEAAEREAQGMREERDHFAEKARVLCTDMKRHVDGHVICMKQRDEARDQLAAKDAEVKTLRGQLDGTKNSRVRALDERDDALKSLAAQARLLAEQAAVIERGRYAIISGKHEDQMNFLRDTDPAPKPDSGTVGL